MKSRTFIRFMMLMMSISFLALSCSKDNHGDTIIDETEEQLPENRQDAETRINGKWQISEGDDVRSIEFLDGNTYVIEVGTSFAPQARLSLQARSHSAIKAQTSGSSSTKLFGSFTISADGKTITLDDIIRITITSISDESFTFTLTYLQGNRQQQLSAQYIASVDSSENTTLLARKWGFSAWADFDQANKKIFENHGFKPQDQGLQFTSSGTMLMRYLNFQSSTSVDPETGASREIITSVNLESDIYTWRWKDRQQRVIVFTGIDGHSSEINIVELTAAQLRATLENGTRWNLVVL
ncbi:hypothetical protein [Sphingobacterium sp. FBM7-1]|uniref:hypothetical protein n=1 Tax=Sphingobacterium sp. FBM7-1 TaxID=2886688 RepID=UPI001D0FA68A|nr:hypothetical protein [Sphingobacterium sp. FBM7-1]MCC2599674.1 hypothetical protein [Sphingobacterium sp. FBM7-1]